MDIISPIVNIVSLLCSCSGNYTCYLCDLQENKDALNTAMEELKDTRDDVKRRVDAAENNPNEPMKCNQEVNGWLQRVQTIEGEVVKVIEKADQEIKKKMLSRLSCWSACKIGKLVIRKLAIVNDLRSKGSFADVAYKLPPPLVQKEPVDLPVGMESTFEKVWRALAEDKVRIIGLYGQGGVGKTTLLKQINNELLKGATHVVILVVVSKEININAIQKEIGNRLGLSSPDRTSICNALTKKNFVLLLDDIWERVDLQSIGIPHPENNSKVIFTTRSEMVCGHMDATKKLRVACLSLDVAWTLFKEKVGNETLNSHPKLLELAKVVAEECGGLPLALITIGRAMSTKKTVQEWNHAINTLRRSASEFPGMGDKVLPLLKLSYDSLCNDTIKSCFLYCALYSEDYSIKKAKIIEYWIGEGFLNAFNHIDEARNYGYDVIGILKGACLLESGENEETQVKMHDTIRDLALWINCECSGSKRDKMLTIEAFDGTSERWYNAERIYLRSFGRGNEIEVPPPKSPNLLTLIYDSSSLCNLSIPQNFFQFMPLLRVLDLSVSRMKTFPRSITELLELQYLSLSWIRIDALPEELRKLVKLKYLDRSHMIFLKKIPSGVIGSFVELRVLNLYRCSGADWDLEELYNLKHLNDLRITINTQHNLNKLLSLTNRNLRMYTRHLHLGECNIDHGLFSSPSSLSTIRTLRVNSIKSVRELELLSNLETLSLHSLPELMNMNMAQQHHRLRSFQNLTEIYISECNALKNLTWVGYVGNLKILELKFCEEIEEIIGGDDDFEGTGDGNEIISTKMRNIFESIETLKMTHLPKLKSICRNALAFPCLECLVVEKCPQLKKLPFDSGSNVNNTLQMIKGEENGGVDYNGKIMTMSSLSFYLILITFWIFMIKDVYPPPSLGLG